MEYLHANNVNLQKRDAKLKQMTNEKRHGILQQLLQCLKNKEKLELCVINKLIECVQGGFNKLERNTLDNVL